MGKKSLFTIKRIRNRNPNMMRVRVQKPETLWRLAVLTLLIIAAGIASLLVISDDFTATFLSADGEATASGPVGNSGTYVPGSLTKEQAQAAVQGAKQGMSNGVSQTGQFLNNAGNSLNQQVKNLPAMDQKLMQGGMKDMQTMLGAGANDIGFGNKLDGKMSQGAGQVNNLMANPTASLGGVNKLTGSASSAVEKLGGVGGATSSGSSGIPSTGTAGTGSITSGSAGTSSSSSSVSGGSGAKSFSPPATDPIAILSQKYGITIGEVQKRISNCQNAAQLGMAGSSQIIGVVKFFQSLIGGIAVFFMVYSGIAIISAMGADEVVNKHKKTLLWSLAGLVVVVMADSLVRGFFFVVNPATAEAGIHLRNGLRGIAGITNFIATLVGIFSVVSIIIAGIIWVANFGNTEIADKSKKIIFGAVVGVIVSVSAYAIVNSIIQGTASPIPNEIDIGIY